MTDKQNSRRDFIKTTALGAAGLVVGSRASSYAKILGANDRVRVGVVGPGDRAMDALVPSFLRLSGELNFDLVAISE
ncbi:MAG: twin-arginine translocation signal domain-containing protein, partial [Pyrinomonadaceae bacterium]